MPAPSSLSLRRVAAVFLCAAAAGCGRIPVYPVQGKVTFEGKPLPGGGAIAFVPLVETPGKTAGGFIDEQGNYRLTTHASDDGCMTGEFRVVIQQITEQEGKQTADGERAAGPGASLPAAQRIPAIYSDFTASPLTARVEAKELNVIDFPLKRE